MAAPHAENPKTPSEGSCLPRVFTLGGMLMLIVEKAGGRDRHIIDGREAECVERPRLGCGGVDRLQHREKKYWPAATARRRRAYRPDASASR
jgi:hypothetical protein